MAENTKQTEAEADRDAWFEAAFRLSGTGMSRVRFIEKYRHMMGLPEDVAKRTIARLRPAEDQRQ